MSIRPFIVRGKMNVKRTLLCECIVLDLIDIYQGAASMKNSKLFQSSLAAQDGDEPHGT